VLPALAEACDRALAVKPEDRFATAEEMRAALLEVVEQRWQRNRIHTLSTIMTQAFSDERTSIRSIVERYSRAADEKSDSREHELQLATPVGAIDDAVDVRIDVELPPPLPAAVRLFQWRWAALAGGLLTVASGALAFLFMNRGAPATLPVTASATTPVTRPREVEAERRAQPIELVVVTSPPEARASIDGVVVQGNPVRVKVDRDERLHTIRVEAPGFVPFERTVAFDESLVIKAALSRLVERATPPAPVPAAARAPSPPHRKLKPELSSRPAAPPAAPEPAPARRPGRALPQLDESISPGDDLRQGTTIAPDRAIDEKDPYQP